MEDTAIKKHNLSFHDAMMFKHRFIDNWKPESEVWALKYGDAILGGMATFGSMFITYMFRKELKLRAYARLTCYAPVIGVSGMVSCMLHEYSISTNIILRNSCPLCLPTKASLIQVAFGVGYPIIAATTVCFFMADRLLTYPVPPLTKAPREVFQLFLKIVRKNRRPYFVIGGIHMITAAAITYKKQYHFDHLNIEKKVKPFMK